jgi:hypothetical protein
MSKSIRKKQNTVMSDTILDPNDETNVDIELEPTQESQPEEIVTENDEAPAAEEPAVEPEEAIVEEPANDTKPAPTTSLTKDVLRAVFNKRTVRYVDDTLWAAAVQAVKEGKAVTCTLRPPYLTIAQTQFDPTIKTKGLSSLNAIIAGMI